MREILILQTARLGDMVQTLPLLRRMRRDHPSARITLVAQEGFAGIAEGCGYHDVLIALPQAAIDSLSDPARQDAFPGFAPFDAHPAFRMHYDRVVNLSNDQGSAVLCHLIPALDKRGRVHTYEGELRLLGPWSKYVYSMVTHRLENMFNLVDIQMGIAGLDPRPEPAAMPVPPERRAEARALLEGLRPRRKRIAMQAGASALHRAWALENFAEAARALRDDGFDIVLVGDRFERERCESLAEMIGNGPGLVNLAGRTGLAQLPALLAECDLILSNDTGTIHIAAAVGTPALGLYFSTAYYSETAPYGAGHAVLQVEIPCSPCHASNLCPVQICRGHLPPAAVIATARWLLKGAPDADAPGPWPGLSLYRSRFLADGSLAYLPVRPEAVSTHFQGGLLGRLLWQEALGLAGDPALDALRDRLRPTESFQRLRADLEAALAGLETPVRQGLDLAGKLRAEFDSEMPVRERILFLHQNLSDLGKTLAAASKPAGLCGSFLHFEMMDMDYATYPMLAEILEGKYAMLADWVARFRASLARLA